MTSLDQHTNFNVEKIRKDFPILSRKVNGHPLEIGRASCRERV